ncbi:MAG: peptidylprolyl isomerase [Candidatus Micrarchaeota archaeon]|nr:peptidylprolyl isomerase [Candidatus Micrarchaeota archaeon]MDE1823975.1 peptidylprolyl isomerase [Candidatus Micrarchaeota archaeon]MDE1849973.1 peptidylprolyl isomerase [Candidatus Micrarchaeota archaeon]
MTFNDGDFVRIDYTAKRLSDSAVVYTTDEKAAKDAGIYNKDSRYAPQLVIVGKESVIKGVEKELRKMNVNDSKKIEVAPDEAFGERRDDLVTVMHLSDFRKRDINPEPGLQVDLDGVVAIVKSVNGGRVVVDANHPLAGEKLVYDVKVVEKVESEEKKVAALAEAYGLKPDSVSVSSGAAKISFGDKVEKNADYFVNKSAFVRAAFQYLPNIEKITVDEGYVKQK